MCNTIFKISKLTNLVLMPSGLGGVVPRTSATTITFEESPLRLLRISVDDQLGRVVPRTSLLTSTVRARLAFCSKLPTENDTFRKFFQKSSENCVFDLRWSGPQFVKNINPIRQFFVHKFLW